MLLIIAPIVANVTNALNITKSIVVNVNNVLNIAKPINFCQSCQKQRCSTLALKASFAAVMLLIINVTNVVDIAKPIVVNVTNVPNIAKPINFCQC